ncbi:MAG: SMP-30/gluconolactonase/LRE family protein [Nocardioidaceae bacterium]|nr:SMP-30/gluconolactonase/LRE family protein [Nocardioidaceae bacterium]
MTKNGSRLNAKRRVVGATATLLTLAIAPVSAATPGVSSSASPDGVRTYIVPGECAYPESIDVQGGKYYTGSVCNGNLYRGDLDKSRARVFVPGGSRPYEMGGIKATATRLVVARGKGHASVFNRFTGNRVAEFANGRGYDSTVNDVAIAPNGDAYLTDFTLSKIYRIPARAIAQHRPGVHKLRVFLNLRGTVFPVQDGSANGIATTPDGRFLLVAHFNAGNLYRVRLSNGNVSRVRLHGKLLAAPDGITLKGRDVLYVVEFDRRAIAKIRLSANYGWGRIVSRTTHPSFQCPTSAAIARDRILVVNSQFCGPGEPPWTVSSIPLP